MHCISDYIFGSFCLSNFLPNFIPFNLNITLFFFKKNRGFLKKRLSKLTSIFDPVFGSTWFHLGTIQQNPCKNRFQEAQTIDQFLGSILNRFGLRFGGPTWNHVGHLSRPKTAQDASKTPPRRLQGGSRRFQKHLGWPGRPKTSPNLPWNRMTSMDMISIGSIEFDAVHGIPWIP